MKKPPILFALFASLVVTSLFAWQCHNGRVTQLEETLQTLVQQHDLRPLTAPTPPDPNLVALGQLLFFEKELSGNRDISCATCHHPQLATSDQQFLSIGTGSSGFGPTRRLGENRNFVSRHANDLFNRGLPEWQGLFWEGRVEIGGHNGFNTPAEQYLPDGLDNLLAAQAMFPVTIREEMRGGWYTVAGYSVLPGDVLSGDNAYGEPVGWTDTDVFGQTNELAALPNESKYFPEMWALLMERLLAIPEYEQLFQTAYPDLPLTELGFEHAANALAAFQTAVFSSTNSPWDRYLAGQTDALSNQAKEGAILFYGRANCIACHSGPLLTDHQYHNIGVPQFGPGEDDILPLDYGRYAITQDPADKFAFRTPALHNVALTGPWLHNGAYTSLEEVIRHHLNPTQSLAAFDGSHLPAELQAALQNHPSTQQIILQTLSPQLPQQQLSSGEVAALVAFLESLTDPAATDLADLIPARVPSGLPVADEP